MKQSFVLISFIFFACPVVIYGQRNADDSLFLERLALTLSSELQKFKPDSSSKSEFYSFRFRFNTADNYLLEGSNNITRPIYEAIDRSFKSTLVGVKAPNPFEEKETFFLVPLLVDFSGKEGNSTLLTTKGLHQFTKFKDDNKDNVPAYIMMSPIVYRMIIHSGSNLFKELFEKQKQ